MAYVVTQACINHKHTSCVDVCPVEAFREGPEMLFIDPEVCIDCNACITECPEQAIYPTSAVPADQQKYIALNAESAKILPAIKQSISKETAANPHAGTAGRFAVIGSGPSGFYSAEALLKQMPSATVDIFERLPTPFGLVRYGVAPDHPRIKSVSASFERIAESPQVRFFGNVQIGKDISRQDLLSNYHSVIYATGGSTSRPLNIPGADQKNIHGSSTFVGWYNGHPDHQGLEVDLSHNTATIIGIGNVALDIARILILPTEQLAKTDISDEALLALKQSNISEVNLLARRGPVQAAFTPKELEQLMDIPDLNLIVDPADLELDKTSQVQLQQPEFNEARQNLALLHEISKREKRPGKSIRFLFSVSPEKIHSETQGTRLLTAARNELQPDGKGGVRAKATENSFDIQTGLIVHAIGYQGENISDLPFNEARGVLENSQGVLAQSSESDYSQEFTAGWIKRGASGVIGSNKQCAGDTVNQLLKTLPVDIAPIESDIEQLLTERNIDFITFSDWRFLDEHEKALGKSEGRMRSKITDVRQMLDVISNAKAKKQQDELEQAKLPVKTHFRSCTLCEAMCGVKIEYQGDKILSVAGDPDDPHSLGHICPKGYAIQDLHNDPDRLKTPMEKVNGEWQPIDWDTALDKVAERLTAIQAKYGNDSVGGYWGNPGSHNLGLLLGSGALRKEISSRNMFTAASLDQMPHQLVSYLMFGHGQLFTIPDIDRTDYMLMLGANPAVSNGSLMTAGDILKRLEAIPERGGKVVLIDPRRNETARYVSEHHFIKPAADPLFLIGLIQHIIDQKLYNPGHLTEFMDDWESLLGMFGQFTLDEISTQCGIPASEIKRIAEEFAAAERAVCYGRMGIATQNHSALNHWLILVLNILTGNLDSPGGMMFTTPAFDKSLTRPMGSFGDYKSRVRGLPEFMRQLPSAVIAEEMLTPGEGQIKAFICVAGNPVLTAPNGRMMDEAMDGLDFMVSIDFFLNETSRHADIILPPTGPLEHEQYDIVYNILAVRNLAKFSDALFEQSEEARSDWEIVQGLSKRIAALKNPEEAKKQEGKNEMSPEQIIDYGLRTGPYGKGFTEYNSGEPVEHEEGLSLSVLKKYPHGLDLGPMKPGFPNYLFTKDKKICLMPDVIIQDMKLLVDEVTQMQNSQSLMLIGRRDLRTNNSWMHNSERLVKGKDRCALFVHPKDAQRLSLTDKGKARIISRVGELEVNIKITDEIMQGVVSLPHGWGHHREGIGLSVAQSSPGISANDITDDQYVDSLSGNAIFNGIPVEVLPLNAIADKVA